MVKIEINGIEIKKIFFENILFIKPSELSDVIIVINPKKKIKNLCLKYFELSLEIKKFMDVIRISSGRYKGVINLLKASLYTSLGLF